MKRRKTIIIVSIALFLAIATGITVLLIASLTPRPVSLTIAADWTNPDDISALNAVLLTFRSLYPNITVSARFPSDNDVPQDSWFSGADVIIRSGAVAAGSGIFKEQPVPWSGNMWVLAARKDILDKISDVLPEEVTTLRSGTAAPAVFEKILEHVKTAGYSPVTLGNSHQWPFMLWLQHWTAATAGFSAVTSIPRAVEPGGASKNAYAAVRSAYIDLMRWKTNGWFDESVWNEGWARGYRPLNKGSAAFALVSAQYMTAIAPEARAYLEYLPFPRQEKDSAWSVGQVTFLGIGSGTKELKTSKLIVTYLSSPGIAGRLSQTTGKPFIAWDPKTGRSPAVAAGWEEAALTPAYEALAKTFNPGK